MMRRFLRPRDVRGPAAAIAIGLSLAPPAAVRPQPAAPASGTLTIEHEAPGCVAASAYSRLRACFRPQSALSRARVYFRAAGTEDWFYVEMAGTPPCLEAILPRPRVRTRRIEYYLAATDRSFEESRTPVESVEVVGDGRCAAGSLAPAVDEASVVIGSPTGAAPVGFATGGGVSPLLVLGGVAVVGGAVAIIAGGGERGGPSPQAATPSDRVPTSGVLAASWRSDLAVIGARARVVVDGREAQFPCEGIEAFPAPSGPGPHRLEAMLVSSAGRGGTWRFDFSSLSLVPASLRVVAGEAVHVGPDQAVFRLHGRAGERVVLALEIAED